MLSCPRLEPYIHWLFGCRNMSVVKLSVVKSAGNGQTVCTHVIAPSEASYGNAVIDDTISPMTWANFPLRWNVEWRGPLCKVTCTCGDTPAPQRAQRCLHLPQRVTGTSALCAKYETATTNLIIGLGIKIDCSLHFRLDCKACALRSLPGEVVAASHAYLSPADSLNNREVTRCNSATTPCDVRVSSHRSAVDVTVAMTARSVNTLSGMEGRDGVTTRRRQGDDSRPSTPCDCAILERAVRAASRTAGGATRRDRHNRHRDGKGWERQNDNRPPSCRRLG